jgi:hypothetical protein
MVFYVVLSAVRTRTPVKVRTKDEIIAACQARNNFIELEGSQWQPLYKLVSYAKHITDFSGWPKQDLKRKTRPYPKISIGV